VRLGREGEREELEKMIGGLCKAERSDTYIQVPGMLQNSFMTFSDWFSYAYQRSCNAVEMFPS